MRRVVTFAQLSRLLHCAVTSTSFDTLVGAAARAKFYLVHLLVATLGMTALSQRG